MLVDSIGQILLGLVLLNELDALLGDSVAIVVADVAVALIVAVVVAVVVAVLVHALMFYLYMGTFTHKEETLFEPMIKN